MQTQEADGASGGGSTMVMDWKRFSVGGLRKYLLHPVQRLPGRLPGRLPLLQIRELLAVLTWGGPTGRCVSRSASNAGFAYLWVRRNYFRMSGRFICDAVAHHKMILMERGLVSANLCGGRWVLFSEHSPACEHTVLDLSSLNMSAVYVFFAFL